MADRRDAGAALIRFGAAVHDELPTSAGPDTVWTIGRISLEPGAPSIIPGSARLTLQVRDPCEAHLEKVEAAVHALVTRFRDQGPADVSIDRTRLIRPTGMDPQLQAALQRTAEATAPGRWCSMHSSAGHDAMVLAHHLPTGMLFVPSIGGISHDYAENTSDEDIVLGAQVYADTVAGVAGEQRAGSP